MKTITRPFWQIATLRLSVLLLALIFAAPAFCGAIQDAAKDGDLDKVKQLVAKDPKLVFSKDEDGMTALHWAAVKGHKDVAAFLLDNKADVHAKDNNGKTAYQLASFHPDVAELLRTHGGKMESKSHDPAIFKAAGDGDLETVKKLVEDDPGEVLNVDEDLRTPLNWAANDGHAEVVAYLLDHKSDIEAKNVQNETALMDAAYLGHADVVKLLLERGADISAVNTNKLDKDTTHGMTALHFAASKGNKDVAEVLIAFKPDVNFVDQYGMTPLHHAVLEGWGGPEENYKQVALLLLKNGAKVDARDNGGRTPLYCAAQNGKIFMVELLLANGADANARDKKGLTPLHAAMNGGVKNKAVVEFLGKHGGAY